MLTLLIKKQLMEIFKGYFYDAKNNKKRARNKTILWFVFYGLLMVVVLGGIFTLLAVSLCSGLAAAGADWLYWLIMIGMTLLLGTFGSAFSTYAGLYKGKDNDLLLSMPIPIGTLVGARLISVYLMGILYSAVVFLPAAVVYGVFTGFSFGKCLCALLLYLAISALTMVLSCLLGWVIAKISLKLKRKSVVSVLAALLFLGAYYFFYFRAEAVLQDLLLHAAEYGENIKGSAYLLYLIGRSGTGDILAAAALLAASLVLLYGTWLLLKKTFLGIATASEKAVRKQYREKTVREKSALWALVGKELGRFSSSSNYMMNCGLGIAFVIAAAAGLLIKGEELLTVLGEVFAERPGTVEVLLLCASFLLITMIDPAAPALSLEGKCLWIPKSLPVEGKTVLRAKTLLQLLLTLPPLLLFLIAALSRLELPLGVMFLYGLTMLLYAVFFAAFASFLGTKLPMMNWTNEIVPIKQGAAVAISIFGPWAAVALYGGGYLIIGYRLGLAAYLAVGSLLFAGVSALLLRWLDTKGAERLQEL